jgi:hypothetical protein
MSLRDDIAADEAALLLDQGILAQTMTLRPDDGAEGGAVVALVSPAPEAVALGMGAAIEARRAVVRLLKAPVQTVLDELLGEDEEPARPLREGDALDAADGPHKGTWIIESVRPSFGGNYVCAARWERPRILGTVAGR